MVQTSPLQVSALRCCCAVPHAAASSRSLVPSTPLSRTDADRHALLHVSRDLAGPAVRRRDRHLVPRLPGLRALHTTSSLPGQGVSREVRPADLLTHSLPR